jgi:phage baseplate assembly protein W
MATFFNPTSQRVRTVPSWFGPVLPVVTNRGTPLALVNPFATSDPQAPGPVFPSAASYRLSITSSLNMLFATLPGERLFLPTYGLNMEAQVFEASDEHLISDAQAAIRSAIERFETRVSIVDIVANKDVSKNAVSFLITMQIRGSTPNDLLTYSTPSTPRA